jgi:hypothetical protein
MAVVFERAIYQLSNCLRLFEIVEKRMDSLFDKHSRCSNCAVLGDSKSIFAGVLGGNLFEKSLFASIKTCEACANRFRSTIYSVPIVLGRQLYNVRHQFPDSIRTENAELRFFKHGYYPLPLIYRPLWQPVLVHAISKDL